MGFFGKLWSDLSHPSRTVHFFEHHIKKNLHEASVHPYEAAALAVAPAAIAFSPEIFAAAATSKGMQRAATKGATSAASSAGGTASGSVAQIVGGLNKYVNEASSDLAKLTGPITADIQSVSSLVQNVNDHLIAPISSDIHAVMNLQSSIEQAQSDDLHHGILGMLRFARDVSGSLTSADAVLSRSNEQLGETQTRVAEDVLAPGMQWAGSIPATMGVYHDALMRARMSVPDRDFPHVDIESPKSVAGVRDLMESAVNFVLHPGKMKAEEVAQANEDLKIYRGGMKPDGKLFAEIMETELAKGLAEITPSLSWITRTIFELFLAARGIDIMYAQQEELWRQDLRAATPASLLGVGELIAAERRGIITREERVEQGLKTGLDPSRQKVAWELSTWLIPPEVAIDWHARGYIDAPTMASILAWSGISEADQGHVISGSYRLASPGESIAVRERNAVAGENFLPDSLGTEPPADVQAAYARNRIEQEQAALDWAAHWKIPPVSWWITAYFRGDRTYSEMVQAARAENIPPDVIGDLVGIAQETIQQWMLPDIIATGMVTDEEFRSYAAYIGMEPQSAGLLLRWGKSKEKQPIAKQYADLAEVTLTTARALYDQGTIDRATLIGVFRAHGYSADAAELTAEAADLAEHARRRKEGVETLAAEVNLGVRSEQAALDEAYKAEWTPVEVERLKRTIQHKKLGKTKLPSEEKLEKMQAAGLLTTPEYVQSLELIGYSRPWAMMTAALALGITMVDLESQL